MNSSFSSGHRTALFAARKRTTALAAVGLSGAVAVCVLSLPGGAQAQSKGGSPRAPFVPPGRKPVLSPPVKVPTPRPVVGVPLAGSRENTLREALVAYQWQLATGVNGENANTTMAYLKALPQRDAMPVTPLKETAGGGQPGGGVSTFATRVNIGSTKGPWEFLGPQGIASPLDGMRNLVNPLIGQTNVSGRVNAVAYDPLSSQVVNSVTAPEIFYIATSNSGVWRYNSTANTPVPPTPSTARPYLSYGRWEPLSDGTTFPILETSAIAVHPTRRNTLFAGTGDYPGRQSFSYGIGIMRSTDGGKTWLNVGNGNPNSTPGTVPPVTTTPANAPIMEGTSVSSIVIDPVNPDLILVSTGRGNPGRQGALWRSTDGGNTWAEVTPTGFPGNWSRIDYSASPTTSANGPRTYYASLEGVGVFRSDDQGVVWTQIPNLPLVYTDSILVAASKLPRQAVRATDAQGSDIVYVLEASQSANDSRQFKSLDRGNSWIEITGLPTAVLTDNNFTSARYALDLLTATVPVVNTLATPDANGNYPTLKQEALYGSGRTFGGGRGGVFLSPEFLYSFDPVTQTSSPTYFDLGVQPPFVDISESLLGGLFNQTSQTIPSNYAHVNQHGSAVSPNDDRRVLTVNDGGVNRFIYTNRVTNPNTLANGVIQRTNPNDPTSRPALYLDNTAANTAWVPDTTEAINNLLGLGAFDQADFIYSSNTSFGVVGSLYQNQAVQGRLTFTGVTPTAPVLSGAAWNLVRQIPVGNGTVNRDANGQPIDDVPTQPNTNGVPTGNSPGVKFLHTNSSLYFNPFDITGNTQYGATGFSGSASGGDNWPTGRLFWSNTGFVTTGNDITPDRYFTNGQFPYDPLPNANGASVNIYNSNDPNDATTATNWRGEPKPPIPRWAFGTAHQLNTRGPVVSPNRYNPVAPTSSPALPVAYIGTNRLWRFDPPGQATAPLQPGTTSPVPGPNKDRGIWRRVGNQQLASGTGTISAIAISESRGNLEGSVAYVGTTNGELWVSNNLTVENGATLPLPPLTATWTQIAGPGSGNATLPSSPNNPITSISINSVNEVNSATYGDILVGLGGSPTVNGPARVYRATNTLGVPQGVRPTFTAQRGQGFASLPDVPVNDITRDPDDPTNTIFVATDVGVFTSTNAGATWSNATAPLGLPNVRCTNIKVVPPLRTTQIGTNVNRFLMVSTYGRGVFRFDLNNLSLTATNPSLTFSQTFSRSGNLLVVNLTITNTGATAQNVLINSASLLANGVTTQATNPADGNPVTVTPISVGAVGSGQSTTVALRYPASVGRAGTAVVFNVGGEYTLPPFPPGTRQTFSNDPGVRTRLP